MLNQTIPLQINITSLKEEGKNEGKNDEIDLIIPTQIEVLEKKINMPLQNTTIRPIESKSEIQSISKVSPSAAVVKVQQITTNESDTEESFSISEISDNIPKVVQSDNNSTKKDHTIPRNIKQ